MNSGERCGWSYSYGRLVLMLAAIAAASCESEEYRKALDSGLCVQNNTYLSDQEFIEIVLSRRETDAWEGLYPSPADFIAANPKCCAVRRFPTEKEWGPGASERVPRDTLRYGLSSIGPSRYLVAVSINYPSRRNPTLKNSAAYLLGSCGDVFDKTSRSEY
jgi:hypothetical protein